MTTNTQSNSIPAPNRADGTDELVTLMFRAANTIEAFRKMMADDARGRGPIATQRATELDADLHLLIADLSATGARLRDSKRSPTAETAFATR